MFANKRNLIVSLVALLLCLIVLPTMTVGWFYVRDHATINLEMLEINSQVILYEASDANYNGVPDLSETTETTEYYTETHAFTKIGDDWATNTEPEETAVKLNIEITNLLPSEIRTYKLSLINNGDADNSVHLNFDVSDVTNTTLLSTITVRSAIIDKDGNPDFTHTEAVWLSDITNGESDAVFSEKLSGMVSAMRAGGDMSDTTRDFWIFFCMEPMETVNAHIAEKGGTAFTTGTYNALMGQNLDKLAFHVYFDVTDTTEKAVETTTGN